MYGVITGHELAAAMIVHLVERGSEAAGEVEVAAGSGSGDGCAAFLGKVEAGRDTIATPGQLVVVRVSGMEEIF